MKVWISGGETPVREAVAVAVREQDAEPVTPGDDRPTPSSGDAVIDLGLPPASWSGPLAAAEEERAGRLAQAVPDGVRVVRVSVIGADAGSPVPLKAAAGAAEAALRRSPSSVVALRAGIVLGPCGLTAVLRRFVERSRFVALPAVQRARLEPIALPDLAAYAALAAVRPEPPADVYDLGGGEMLTGALLVKSLADNLGLARTVVPLPFAVGAWCVGRFADEEFPPVAAGHWLRALASGLLPRRMNAWEDFELRPTPMNVALAEAVGMQIPLRSPDDENAGRFGWKAPKKKRLLGERLRRIKR